VLGWTQIDEETELPPGIDPQGPEWLFFRPGAYLVGAPLRNAFLYELSLPRANLAGADLRASCLEHSDLTEANLRFADVRFSALRFASLNGANLTGADLRSANLSGADMRDTDLRGAKLKSAVWSESTQWGGEAPADTIFLGPNVDLRGVNLYWSVLFGADLRNADLRGANLRRATIFGCDLSEAKLDGADLSQAVYDVKTRFPSGFDPPSRGMKCPGQ
jgi:uncharacterized protein YjbI with pentapeptide repeats